MTTPNPIDWKSVDDMLSAWLSSQLGVVAIREKSARPQPPRPYVSFKRDNLVGVHEDARMKVTNLGNPQGEEIERTLVGHREFHVTVQAYSDDTTSNKDAMSMMSIIYASLSFPDVRRQFRRANVAIIDPESIIDLSAVVAGLWVSRAALDIRCRTLSIVLADKIGYIGNVNINLTLQTGVNGDIVDNIKA